MKNIIIRTISGIALGAVMAAFCPTAAEAQEYISTPVSISKEKVRIDGKVCYSHIVLEKQTLFSIAKAYDVSVEDIYQYNPGLRETGLKKNAIILIPAKEESVAEKLTAKAEEIETVRQEKEAAKEERATIKEEKKKQEKKAKKQRIHVRKWYEDLDVIAERYGITAEDIIKANGLKGRKLENRQKLIIPEPGSMTASKEEAATADTEKRDSVSKDMTAAADSADIIVQAPAVERRFMPKDEIKATLILPMKNSSGNISRNNMDFYSGFLLGVRDMAQKGINVELNVYDSSDSTHPIAAEDISDTDMVIGPVSFGDIGRLIEQDSASGTIISPLDPKAERLASTYPNLIQAPTPVSVQLRDLINWIEEETTAADTVLLITEKGAKQNESVREMIRLMELSSTPHITFAYSILEGRDVIEPLTALMTKTGTNRILVASESEAFVNDVVRNLNILIHNKLNVVLYAPSKIRGFETIEVENLHHTSLHVSLAYYIDYDSPEVQKFLLEYRALYNTEPSQYAFQGYDVAVCFIDMCSRYGTDWKYKLEDTRKNMLQSTFDFVAVPEGGYINNGVRRIVYGQDWSIRQVR